MNLGEGSDLGKWHEIKDLNMNPIDVSVKSDEVQNSEQLCLLSILMNKHELSCQM